MVALNKPTGQISRWLSCALWVASRTANIQPNQESIVQPRFLVPVDSDTMTRVFIYGGCASRDAVRYYSPYGMHLVGYIARQSLPSALAPARLKDFAIPTHLPKFQQRMIKGDIESHLPQTLHNRAAEIDLLLWDLNIERSGFYRLKSGAIITRSGVQIKAESTRLEGKYPFGTLEHFEIWENSLISFIDLLRETNLLDKTVINATPWATSIDNNQGTSESELDPITFNTLIKKYWKRAEYEGIKIGYVPPRKISADPKHKWGAAYFHYKPRTYKAQVKLIARIIGKRRQFQFPGRQEIRNILDRHA